jgi:hypothetical protein
LNPYNLVSISICGQSFFFDRNLWSKLCIRDHVKKKRALYFGTEGVVYKPTSVAMSCHLKFVIMCTGHTNMVLKLSFFLFS